MMKRFRWFGLLVVLLWSFLSVAQPRDKFVDPREAEEHMSHNNYPAAIRLYKLLLKERPKDPDYNKKIAICYLNTNTNKAKAIPHLETATKLEKPDNECWLLLGRANHYAGKLDEAIEAYTKYKEKAAKKDQDNADLKIQQCNNAKELMKYPVNVSYENIGKEINSEFPDYYPFVSGDESMIVFTARRKTGGGSETDGFYPSDIYSSTAVKGVWAKAKPVPSPPNSGYDEQASSLSSDGKFIVVYIDHLDSVGNLYVSERKQPKGFGKLVKLPPDVNSGFESSGSISPDGNTIYFCSKRKECIGEDDIFMIKKLPNGKWGLPQNLGQLINTPYREDMPVIAPDGKTLYYASEGHSSMGDFDVFKAIYNEETNTWSAPKNLGYPVNNTDDNRCISFTNDERVAYVSAVREKGLGDFDIYRIKFNDSEPRYSVVHGQMINADSTVVLASIQVKAKDKKTNVEYFYTSSSKTGKFIMALPIGEYDIEMEAQGYESGKDKVIIYDLGSFQPESNKKFIITKKQ